MKSKRRKISHRTHARRTQGLAACIALVATAFVSRAAQLQIAQGNSWRARAEHQTTERVEIPAARGGIFDRSGRPLALSRPGYRAFFAPGEASDREAAAGAIARVVDLSERERRKLLRSTQGWLSIGTVDGREKELLAQAARRGLYFEPIESRIHPEGSLARAVVGLVGGDGRAQSGLELALDTLLRGTPGSAFRQRDARGGLYPLLTEPQSPARPGHDVYLTLDAELQEIAEEALARALEETGATGGDVLIADPRTGDLLAVASRRDASPGTLPAFSDPYEPGSTVKPVLLATLLQEQVADLDDRVYAEHGVYRTPYRTITDVHPHDTLSVADVIRFSSNIGAAKLAERIEPGLQYRYLRDFGFGTPTGLGFPGESSGLLRRPEEWSALSQGSLAYGYELMVTSIQLLAAYGALANEGVLLRPSLVREIRDEHGRTVWQSEVEPIRRLVDAETARRITGVLTAAVEDGGTASSAGLRTLRVAGKTGTARIASGGGYRERRYAASFVGYLPAEAPKLVILTKLEDPKGLYYGGRTAAPLSRSIVQAILAAPRNDFLGGERSRPIRERLDWSPVPAGGGWSIASEASPFRLVADDGLPPGAGSPQPADRLVLPDLTGLEVRSAVSRLHRLGLHVELEAVGSVRAQAPASGTRVVPGATILLR